MVSIECSNISSNTKVTIKVTQINKPSIDVTHTFTSLFLIHKPLSLRISIPEIGERFVFTIDKGMSESSGYYLIASIYPVKCGLGPTFRLSMTARHQGQSECATLDSRCLRSKKWFEGCHFKFDKPVHFSLDFHIYDQSRGNSTSKSGQAAVSRNGLHPKGLPTSLFNDLNTFVARGGNVSLLGSDGSVIVPKRVLLSRSSTFEAMFSHDLKESQTSEVDMKEYKMASLESFVHFLKTDDIKDGNLTALDLYILGDKYDVQEMKKQAKVFVLGNLNFFHEEKVFHVFNAIDEDFVRKEFLGKFKKHS